LSKRNAYTVAAGGLLAYLAWCLGFVWSTSFLIDGERYFCLSEDAMISMTYARNLVEGHGLVWARWGEPVEGFSNPLWTLGLVLVQWSALPLSLRPLLVQLTSLALLLINLLMIYRLARRHLCPNYPQLAWAAPVATAAYFPLNYWALVGMESGLQALLTTLAVLWTFDLVDSQRPRAFRLWCVLTAAAFLRLDMMILVILVLGYVLAFAKPKSVNRAGLLAGMALFALVLGGYAMFRFLYYHDILPNTYWLKMTGGDPLVRIARGYAVFLDVAQNMATVLVVVLAGGFVTAVSRRRHLLLAGLVCGYFAYSIYIGGDVYEGFLTGNRFVCFVIPILTCLAVGVADVVASRWLPIHWEKSRVLPLLLSAWLVLALNGLLVGAHADARWRSLRLDGTPYLYDLYKRVLTDTLRLKAQFPPQTRVSVVWAGIPSYFSDFRMVDSFGYNDRTIATGPWSAEASREQPRQYVPGHMKTNLDFTLREYAPDVFFQTLPAWQQPLRNAGYRRYSTGTEIFRTAGEIWVREPLTLDDSPWQIQGD